LFTGVMATSYTNELAFEKKKQTGILLNKQPRED
jgi:hypothetical protein